MDAILLTPDQAAALAQANITANTERTLVARRLADDRLILNADVLNDPFFTDPTQPWREILEGATPVNLKDTDLAED